MIILIDVEKVFAYIHYNKHDLKIRNRVELQL